MKIAIVGCGGLGRVVAESVIRTGEFELAGFLDDSPEAAAMVDGVRVLGSRKDINAIIAEYELEGFFVALGNNELRRSISAELADTALIAVTLVDSAALVSPAARLGDGVFVAAGCVVGPGVEIGDFSVINTATVIEHDTRIAAGCYLGPGCIIESRVCISEGSALRGNTFMDKGARST